jgi:Zn finger protein HypA/HybF involved in hydrogenase expression
LPKDRPDEGEGPDLEPESVASVPAAEPIALMDPGVGKTQRFARGALLLGGVAALSGPLALVLSWRLGAGRFEPITLGLGLLLMLAALVGLAAGAFTWLVAAEGRRRVQRALQQGGCPECEADLRGQPIDQPCGQCGREHPLRTLRRARSEQPWPPELSPPPQVTSTVLRKPSAKAAGPRAETGFLRLFVLVNAVGFLGLAALAGTDDLLWMSPVFLLQALLPIVALGRWLVRCRARWRIRRGRCGRCAADLSAVPLAQNCPRCGSLNARLLVNLAHERLAQHYVLGQGTLED